MLAQALLSFTGTGDSLVREEGKNGNIPTTDMVAVGYEELPKQRLCVNKTGHSGGISCGSGGGGVYVSSKVVWGNTLRLQKVK